MKTTLEISDHLLIQAKKLAADERRPLRAVVEDALRMLMVEKQAVRPPTEKRNLLPVCDAGRPLPGIDLNHTSKLLEID